MERTYRLAGSNSRSRVPFLWVTVCWSQYSPNRLCQMNARKSRGCLRRSQTSPNLSQRLAPSNWNGTKQDRCFLLDLVSGFHAFTRNPLIAKPVENAPAVVHIYEFPYTLSKEINLNLTDVPRLRSLLIQQQPVLQASWNPVRKGVISLCTGGSSLYTWSDEWVGEDGEEEMAECIGIPAGRFLDGLTTSSRGS